jgi:hypothetical protein
LKRVADKEEIVPILYKFFLDNNIRIDGGLTKIQVWKFYRELKKLENAFTAVYGRVSIKGIGRYKMTSICRAGSERLSPRILPSTAVDRYFKEHPENCTKYFDEAQPKMKLRERVFHILKELQGHEVIEYNN